MLWLCHTDELSVRVGGVGKKGLRSVVRFGGGIRTPRTSHSFSFPFFSTDFVAAMSVALQIPKKIAVNFRAGWTSGLSHRETEIGVRETVR